MDETKDRNLNTDTAKEVECCDEYEVHPEQVLRVRESLPDDQEIQSLSDLFKAFGDFSRLRILAALSGGEICVCDLADVLGMTQSAVSHQLKILRQARLVGSRREGRTVYYFLSDEHVRTILNMGIEHISEQFIRS